MEPPPSPANPARYPVPELDPEQRVIARVLASRPGSGGLRRVRIDAGDDAAVLDDGTAWTTDTLVEGVHFDDRLSAEDVGYKALAVSVSDLASMGACPAYALLSLALPAHDAATDNAWLEGFSAGLGQALARWDVHLVGGDTVRTPGPRTVTIALGGPLVAQPLTRAGARPGDRLWVTGIPGLAGAGWRREDPLPDALAALRRPDPPLAFALDLARQGLASAAMDLSDGLGADVPRLASASGVALVLDPAALPDHAALADDPQGHRFAGGDDYQLLFTAPERATPALLALAPRHGVMLHAIGEATDGQGAWLSDHTPWPGAFSHFPAPEAS